MVTCTRYADKAISNTQKGVSENFVNQKVEEFSANLQQNIDKKADAKSVYTKSQTNNLVADEIAKVIADASEDFDTLKEIADFIESDKKKSAQLISDVSSLKTDKVDKEDGKGLSTTDVTLEMVDKWDKKQDTLNNIDTIKGLSSIDLSLYFDGNEVALLSSGRVPVMGMDNKKTIVVDSLDSDTIYNLPTGTYWVRENKDTGSAWYILTSERVPIIDDDPNDIVIRQTVQAYYVGADETFRGPFLYKKIMVRRCT